MNLLCVRKRLGILQSGQRMLMRRITINRVKEVGLVLNASEMKTLILNLLVSVDQFLIQC